MLRTSRLHVPREQIIDCACLATLVFLLAAPFLTTLGFYSDDWWIFHQFQSDLANNRFGVGTMVRGFEGRPLQGAYLAGLFSIFRSNPLGYHLVNTAVVAASVAAFYLLLLRLTVERALAFAAVAIFIVLPQLSTARIWYSTFQIPLSMLFAFLSLHAQLSFARVGGKWRVAAAAAWAVLSIAAYEIFAPLIVAFPLWLAFKAWREGKDAGNARRFAWLSVATVVTVALVVVAKGAVTDRAQAPSFQMYMKGLLRLVKPDYDWRLEGSLNIFATVEVNLWQTLLGLWRGSAAAIGGELPLTAIVAGTVFAILSLWRLMAPAGKEGGAISATGALVIGAIAFVVAHATFLISSQIQFSATGIGNRALVGMAIGLALAFAGILAVVTGKFPGQKRKHIFAVLTSLVLLAAAWRTEQIYLYWTESWSIEQRLLASARTDLRDLPARSTVIFDGVCPYHGPGIVMETWEAADMLSLALGREVWADTSADRMQIRRDGLTTTIYNETQVYPYGPTLYVYDPKRHFVVRLVNYETAIAYFSNSESIRNCPKGYVSQGVLI